MDAVAQFGNTYGPGCGVKFIPIEAKQLLVHQGNPRLLDGGERHAGKRFEPTGCGKR